MPTPYHAKYFSHLLTLRGPTEGIERLSMSLFDACVDLNPHQIEAALFALRSPLSRGVILADEVGLGKTIEAGLVLCQFWAERKRRLLVISPASLRKQWSIELEEKFYLPSVVLDTRAYKQIKREGNPRPFDSDKVVICSIHFASNHREEIRSINWDLVVIDEAHKLRNAYRPSNVMGSNIRWALEDTQKLLLTATPLQNSLLELYGLSTFINKRLFGDVSSFRSNFMNRDGDLDELKYRLEHLCQRTLRSQVLEYIKYTERKTFTCPFSPTDEEQELYQDVSEFLNREDTYSIPYQQRHLVVLIAHKLLASSSSALVGTLQTMKERLENLRDEVPDEEQLAEELIYSEEMEEDYIEEVLLEDEGQENEKDSISGEEEVTSEVDLEKLNAEIEELEGYIQRARNIKIDSKAISLLQGLKIGFQEMEKMGAARKAIIFTESRRTQDYLENFLASRGYDEKLVTFNGTNSSPRSKKIYQDWLESNEDTGRITGSLQVDIRTALIEYFRDEAEIMIATEAAGEGVNLQFCSLVINYDLPWNPQRIEQRIGRCHRYGQNHDVVVVNFLNERNEADRRVLELLTEKFNLFDGVFGASDEVLGSIESGVDFEKKISEIYQQCRNPEEIQRAFQKLQKEMEETIENKMDETRDILLEHFDEDVHQRLKVQLDNTKRQLDKIGQLFWRLTKFILSERAHFDDQDLSFTLKNPPNAKIKEGTYSLISKKHSNLKGDYLYRFSHPLGEYVLDKGKSLETPYTKIKFDITNHPKKISLVEQLKGEQGWLILQKLTIESFRIEEYLLFSGFTTQQENLDHETCEKLFHCEATMEPLGRISQEIEVKLRREAKRHRKATINESMEKNDQYFKEEQDRLEKWAEDMIFAAEKALKDTKNQIRAARRNARKSTTTEEQHEWQKKISSLEKQKRKQRQNIFDKEDEIEARRDELIESLEDKMNKKTDSQVLFMARWEVV